MNEATLETALSILKFASILVAGIFGVLALLVDYKDVHTGKITLWGRIALVGVLLTAVIGAGAQAADVRLNREIQKREFTEYQRTLEEFSRVLLPLEPQRVDASFRIPADMVNFQELGNDAILWNGHIVSLPELLHGIGLSVRLYQPPKSLEQLSRYDSGDSDYSYLARHDGPANIQGSSADDQFAVGAIFNVREGEIWASGSTVRAIPDLPGTQMAVSFNLIGSSAGLAQDEWNELITQDLELRYLVLRFGELQLDIPVERMESVDNLFVYQFPQSMEELWALSE